MNMKRPLILLFIILCVFGVPLGAAPPEAPLKDPGTDLNGTITVSPSSPNGSWPSSGESSSLSPKRTASITVTVLDGKDPNGVSYSVKKTQVLSAKCDDPNVLWIKPADGRGTFQLTNTSQDACGAAFTVKITWTPDAGSGGGGGSPPPDIEGTAAGSVSLLDSTNGRGGYHAGSRQRARVCLRSRRIRRLREPQANRRTEDTGARYAVL